MYFVVELFSIPANIDWESAFSKGVGQFRATFSRSIDVPANYLARIVRTVNAYFVADSIHTKKLCSRLSSSELQF